MRRIIAVIIIAVTCVVTLCGASAESSSIDTLDLSVFSTEELIILKNRIEDEINSRQTSAPSSNVTLTTDKEITFNDFIWGMDAQSALRMLIEKKLVKSYASISAPVSVRPWDDEFGTDIRFYEDSGLRISEWCWGETNIAGYDVQETDAFFYYDYHDGIVNLDEAASHLYSIQVHLTATDFDYAEMDVKAKLTTLFGEPQVTVSNRKSTTTVCYLWYGINNTALCLYHYTSNGDNRYDSLMLIYGKTDGAYHLTKVEEIVLRDKRERERQNGDNFNGL